MLKFSILTPSLQRPSLVQCCESVNEQTYASWQQIIMVDCAEFDADLMEQIEHPQRRIIKCPVPHGNYGNRCRHNAWEFATGDYLVMLDDDNAMYRPDALADIAASLEYANLPDFAIFPIHRHGRWFFHDPPGMCYVDSANLVVKREIGRWPDIEAREADGVIVEALKEKYKYAAFPEVAPIILMEYSSNGI